MTQSPGPGKWRLAGIFLAIAIPLMALAWIPEIFDSAGSDWTGIGLLIGPIIAAAVTGMWWRSRLSFYPNWAMRRPYSRRMAFVLLVAQYVLNTTVMWAILVARHGGVYDSPLTAMNLDGQTLALLIPVLLVQLLICMIQTEIGLFLGVWIKDRVARSSS